MSEKQTLEGNLNKYKLLIIPAVKYTRPEVADALKRFVINGGTVVIVPESFIFDQYARENNKINEFGIDITNVRLPPVLGQGESVQNYDQSISQEILYGEVSNKINTIPLDIFSDLQKPHTFTSEGIVQKIVPGNHQILATFDDGDPAILLTKSGRGSIYTLASPLKTTDYHYFFSLLANTLIIKRPVIGLDTAGNLITEVEVRALEREKDILVYASNLSSNEVDFELNSSLELGTITDLRSLKVTNPTIKLGPYEETIYRIDK